MPTYALPENFDGECGHKRGNRHIYNVVSNQNRAEHLAWISRHLQNHGSPRIAGVRQCPYADFVDCGQGRL